MRLKYLVLLLIVSSVKVVAQDEGIIVKKDRITNDKGVFFGLGPSFTLGKNIGDYNTGLNIEGGYLKRVNRVLSLGGSLSYLKFKYAPEETGINNIFIGEEDYNDEYYYRPALIVDFKGGDLKLISFGLNLKLNFIPVKDNSAVSFYGFAKPFLSIVNRTEVTGVATIFNIYDLNDDGEYDEEEATIGLEETVEIPWEAGDPTWAEYGVDISNDLKKKSSLTGGIILGPGIEINPAKKFALYAQAGFGYTFPITFVGTKAYEGSDLNDIDEKYPINKKGFPSINFQAGVSYNF